MMTIKQLLEANLVSDTEPMFRTGQLPIIRRIDVKENDFTERVAGLRHPLFTPHAVLEMINRHEAEEMRAEIIRAGRGDSLCHQGREG